MSSKVTNTSKPNIAKSKKVRSKHLENILKGVSEKK